MLSLLSGVNNLNQSISQSITAGSNWGNQLNDIVTYNNGLATATAKEGAAG